MQQPSSRLVRVDALPVACDAQGVRRGKERICDLLRGHWRIGGLNLKVGLPSIPDGRCLDKDRPL